MNDSKLLNQIGNLIDEKIKPIKEDLSSVKKDVGGVKKDVQGIKQQLETVEIKVELVNTKVDELDQKVDQMGKKLSKKIDQSQEETIDALSALIHEGYNSHEKRIKIIEKHLQLPQAQ